MKRLFYSLGLMLAASLTLTNCTKEIENPVQEPESAGNPFEIVASTVDTKTVNDGMSTKWAKGDQINLFHAVTDDTDYKNNGAFTVSDVETGHFTGNLCESLDPQEEYDWYAFYPYSSYIKTPANTNAGYMTVGSKSNEKQVQTGNNSSVHIAGPNYPLAGRATAVPAGDTPTLIVSHLSSLIAINVTNDTEESLTVEEIAFTAPVDIIGTYYINFAREITPESFKNSGTNYVSNVATLTVKDGMALANGESAKFYLAVRPFTAESGKELGVSVNGYSKKISLSNALTFNAGKIRTLNFSYDKVEAPVPDTAAEVAIDFSALGYANGVAVSSVDAAPVSVKFAKGGNSGTAPTYYTTGTAVRVYGGNTFTISTLVGKILNIEFTFGTGEEHANNFSVDSGTYADKKWSGSAQSVTFTVGGETGHRRIKQIKVTYDTFGETIESVQLVAPQVTCTTQTPSSLVFSWNAVEHARAYEVSFNGETPKKVIETTYTADNLNPETEYKISVKAIGDGTFFTDSELTECSGTTTEEVINEGTPVDATLSFANKAQRTSFSTTKQVWVQNGITFTNDKAASTNAVADYANPVRLYANSKVTVAAPGNITKIVFDCNSSSYATTMKNSIGTVSGAAVSVASDKVTVTFTNSVESFVVAKLTAQVRLDKITVTYLQ